MFISGLCLSLSAVRREVSKNKDVETWDNPEFLLEIREGIAYCTLNRPDANNAMNDGA